MKIFNILITAFVFCLLATPATISAQGGGSRQPANVVKFDKAKFDTEIKRLFNGNVMGYQVILMKDGKVVSELADGKARNGYDGEAKMTVNTPANIGSTAKFFGGTALLKEFQKTSNLGAGFDSWLAEPIHTYFPAVWMKGMHPSITHITFRDLLQHKAGFIHGDPSVTVFFDYLSKGVSSDQTQEYAKGKSKYANASITLIGYLLPFVQDKNRLKEFNQIVAAKKLKANDVEVQTMLGNNFETYMRNNIFNATTPKVNPTCDATTVYPAKNIIFANSYSAPNSVFKGSAYSSKIDNASKACHAAGGWYITGRELAAYAANVLYSDAIITSTTRKKMFDDDAPENKLLWSFTIGDSSLAKNFKWNATPYMGGDHDGAHGTIMLLPAGYSAVGIVNSDIIPANKVGQYGGSWLLTSNIVKAFDAGVADNF